MKDFESIFLKDAQSWREWLEQNHDKVPGIWLIYFKKHTGQQSVNYEESVEEALCFGWIDSIVRRIDEDTYMHKFTPRKPNSKWSLSNKKRVEKLIKSSKMRAPGLKTITIARENGKWDESDISQIDYKFADDFISLLQANHKAIANYEKLPPSHKKHYTQWVMSAKKSETRIRRFKEMIDLLEKDEKLGMK